ncbi:(d)CMP kinase [Phycisphaerales bacterium AB-hyl4]|uniref:Cytidylate kinase n=1 Tax=Natronomicrosphaera hydrolytica TaxID=3242702 RepID=A0ABV4U4C0_9BACT
MQRLIVTLDGPAGSGKSTVARMLADRLGVEFLDTGAMYRGLTAKALDRGINPAEEGYAVVGLARNCDIRFDFGHSPPRLFIGSQDMTERLRDQHVTAHVSDVAALAGVRQVLVDAQRKVGAEHPRLVTEGRDQGSVVFPNADVKFYLDARAAVRAQRRADQIRASGRHADLEAIRDAIVARDHKDSTRADGPLICPEDAQRIDTSEMTLDEVVDLLERRVREAVEATA